MRLVSSDLALEVCLALLAVREATLAELARAVDVAPSAAQKALGILVDDGVVAKVAGARPRYRLSAAEVARHVVGLALEAVSVERAVAIAARANPSLELVAVEGGALTVVLSAASDALDQSAAARCVERVAGRRGLTVRYFDHDDLRRRLLSEPSLRCRFGRARILVGDLDRTVPDRSRHGMARGRALMRPHEQLRVPRPRLLREIAKRHGVRSLRLFGSAARTDFRHDSDVDVLVRFRTEVKPTLRSLISLERELEAAFGRDVDLVREEVLLPEARERTERDAVPLL